MSSPALQRTRAALLVSSLGFPLLAPLLWQVSPVAALLPSFAAHLGLLLGILRPNNALLGPVVTRFEPDAGRREVWLTIDDGPDPVDSPRLLDALERHRARATFFLCGARARVNPGLVRTILARGHAVANHTDTHPSSSFWALPPGRVAREVDLCNRTLADLSPDRAVPRLFRAPVGMQNFFLGPLLTARGMRLVGWSARGLDGVPRPPAAVVARLLRGLRPGAILLLHEGRRGPAGERLNVLALERLLPALRERGYAAVLPREEQLRS